tara:strand:+ start:14003 stop:16021 length:2019 start_codon:yes stop_codon:yes gene_type:complete
MANKTLTYTIKANVDGVDKTIKKTADTMDNLNEAVSKYEGLLGKAKVGSKSFDVIKGKLKDLKKEQEKATIASMSFGEAMTSIPGPIGMVSQGVKGLGSTMKILAANPVMLFVTLLVGGLKMLFDAFKSTKKGGEQVEQVMAGVGAAMDVLRDLAVTLVDMLIGVFKDPKQAVLDLWEAIKTNLYNRLIGIVEFLPKMGQALKQAFSLDFSGAAKTAADAVGMVVLGVENVTDKAMEMGEAISDVFKEVMADANAAAGVKKTLQQIADAQRELNVRRAEQNKEIALAKERINDENLSYAERIDALNLVAVAEKKLADDQLSLSKRKLAAMELEASLSDSNAETLDAIAQQKITIANEEMESAMKSKQVATSILGLTNRQLAAEKTAAAEKKRLDDEELKRIELLSAAEYDRKKRDIDAEFELLMMADVKNIERLKEVLNQQMMLELANADLTTNEKLLILKKYGDAKMALDEAVALNEKELADKKREQLYQDAAAAAGALNLIADAVGKETALGKTAAIGSATISALLAANQAYASVSAIPFVGPVLGVAAAAAALAAGYKNVQEIRAVSTAVPKFQSGGLVRGAGSGKSDSINAQLSMGESVINARSTQMFQPLLSKINQLGGGSSFDNSLLDSKGGGASGGMPPMKAYVVSQDMGTQLQLDREVKSRSIF